MLETNLNICQSLVGRLDIWELQYKQNDIVTVTNLKLIAECLMTLLCYYNLICTENWIIPLVHEGSVIKEKIGRWNLPASKVVLWDQIEQNPNTTSFTPALETDESLVWSSFGRKKLLISPCLFGTIQHWCIRRAGRLNKTLTVSRDWDHVWNRGLFFTAETRHPRA